MPRALVLDAARSRLTVRTRATGLLARFAHDLELAAPLTGHADLDGDAWSGELRFPVAALEVVGVVKAGRVDASVLSRSDQADISKRMRDDAFRGASEVRVHAEGTTRDRAALTITIGAKAARVSVAFVTLEQDAGFAVNGRAPLSLKALGSREIKAPLGAFSVEDEIAVGFELFLA